MLITHETHPACEIYDANGLRWKNIIQVNTETGEALQCDADEDGNPLIDKKRGCPTYREIKLAAPVIAVPKSVASIKPLRRQ